VDAGVARRGRYRASWAAFDNATGEARSIDATPSPRNTSHRGRAAVRSARLPYPGLRTTFAGACRMDAAVDVFFTRTAEGWRPSVSKAPMIKNTLSAIAMTAAVPCSQNPPAPT
jgi:hypothetical protein